jgi:hypothetical protein
LENWKRQGTEEWVHTFAIITTMANELVRAMHDRMPPVIRHPDKYHRWPRMDSRLRLTFKRLRTKLRVLPLAYCGTAVAVILLAATVDLVGLDRLSPRIDRETIEKLLSIIAANMLSVTVFAVASMVTSYNRASTTATPRAFPLLLADDFSRAALSRYFLLRQARR